MILKFFATIFLYLTIFSNALAVTISNKPDLCRLDGKKAVSLANREGYQFKVLKTQGNPECTVNSNGEIFIVSANTVFDAKCTFALFIPPNFQTSQPIARVAIKSQLDSSVQFIEKNSNYKVGFIVVLTAKKIKHLDSVLLILNLYPLMVNVKKIR